MAVEGEEWQGDNRGEIKIKQKKKKELKKKGREKKRYCQSFFKV